MVEWIIAAIIVGVVVAVCRANGSRSGRNNRNNTNNTNTVRPPAPAPQSRPAARPAPRTPQNETGPMVYFANDRHGNRDREYRFNYKLVNGGWRAYILRMPSLGSRDSGAGVTHRLYDGGRPYICWDSRVTSLKDMQNISRAWADSIQEYIATGKRFGPGHN